MNIINITDRIARNCRMRCCISVSKWSLFHYGDMTCYPSVSVLFKGRDCVKRAPRITEIDVIFDESSFA